MKSLKILAVSIMLLMGLPALSSAQNIINPVTLTSISSVESKGIPTFVDVIIRGSDSGGNNHVFTIKSKDLADGHGPNPIVHHCRNSALRVMNKPNKLDLTLSGFGKQEFNGATFNMSMANEVKCNLSSKAGPSRVQMSPGG